MMVTTWIRRGGRVRGGMLAQAIIPIGCIVAGGGEAVARDADTMSVIPFEIITVFESPRPIVTVEFNGQPISMMLHSQAQFPGGDVQLRHAQAARFGVTIQAKGKRYGIDRPGHVSDLGSHRGSVATLKIGDTIQRDVPISVFEVPQKDMGMIGFGWLRSQRVLIDYGEKRAVVAPSARYAAATRRRLLAGGYKAVPLTMKGGFYDVSVSVNGVSRRMGIGSATPATLDTAFAAAAGVRDDGSRGNGSGPTGTASFSSRAAAPVRFVIDGWTSPPITETKIADVYGYTARDRPANPLVADGGNLGGEFLTATRAVIDSGNGVLFVMRR